jgi:hypothetical protein
MCYFVLRRGLECGLMLRNSAQYSKLPTELHHSVIGTVNYGPAVQQAPLNYVAVLDW